MFRNLGDLTKAAAFYGITFALALLVAMLPSGESGDLAQLLSMLIPAVAVLLMLLVVTRDGRERAAWRALGLGRAGRRAWAAALLVPALILAVSYAALWGTDIAAFGGPEAGPADLAINTAITFAIVLVFALAEEIGWRGYLLPKLRSLGDRGATLLTGLLHGLFHLPLLPLTPFYHGAGDRLIVVPLFLLSLTLAGPFYGFLRLTTGSVWPAALAHTALNATWGLLDGLTVASSSVAAEYLAGESGLLPLLGYTVVAAWCLSRLVGQPPATTRSAAPATPTVAARVR